jgi:O-antigen ligase
VRRFTKRIGYPHDAFTCARAAWLFLAFLQPFNQFGALRWIALAVLSITLAILVSRNIRKSRAYYPAAWTNRIGLILLGWIVVTSLFGPYPQESLVAMRKDLIAQVMIFAAGLLLVQSSRDAWRFVMASLMGFGLMSLLSTSDAIASISSRGLGDRSYSHDSWWGGYGGKGGYFLPLLLGWLIFHAKRSWALVGGTIFLFLTLALVALYGSRSPLIVATIGGIALIFFRFGSRSAVIGATFALLLLGALMSSPFGNIFRYNSLIVPNTYITNEGLSSRPKIWDGMLEIIQVRPMSGYGYGWKKLAWVINDRGFAERWRNGSDPADYFLAGKSQASYGRVNPHNYYLQVLFEIGAVGLTLVLIFWTFVFREGLFLLRKSTPKTSQTFAVTTLAVLIAYFVANLTNGYWVGGLANLSLSLAGCMLSVSRISRLEMAKL